MKSKTNVRSVKVASLIGFLFFAVAVTLSPKSEGRFEMSWPIFLCTWGVTLAAAFFILIKDFTSRSEGKRISRFYPVCSALLLAGFTFSVNYGVIVRFLSEK